MPAIPEISLCMIVRDEERCLRRCLDSAAGFVSERFLVIQVQQIRRRRLLGN